MNYLLDTNICIALLKGKDHQLKERFVAKEPAHFSLCSVVKAELVFGAQKSERVAANLLLLQELFQRFESYPFDDRAANYYGAIRVYLEKAGTPIGANDMLIAGIAQAQDLTVLTRNRDEFARVPGLKWETW